MPFDPLALREALDVAAPPVVLPAIRGRAEAIGTRARARRNALTVAAALLSLTCIALAVRWPAIPHAARAAISVAATPAPTIT